jgi:hypothetical protein
LDFLRLDSRVRRYTDLTAAGLRRESGGVYMYARISSSSSGGVAGCPGWKKGFLCPPSRTNNPLRYVDTLYTHIRIE